MEAAHTPTYFSQAAHPWAAGAKGWHGRNAADRAPHCNTHSLLYPIKEAKLESKGQRHTVVLALYNWQGWGQQQLVHTDGAEQSNVQDKAIPGTAGMPR